MTPLEILHDITQREQWLTERIDQARFATDLSGFDKILVLIHLGSRFMLNRSDLLTFRGILDPTNPEVANCLKRLNIIANIAPQHLLASREIYFSFAYCAYLLQHHDLLTWSISFGARLNYESYFVNAHKVITNMPAWQAIAQQLAILLFDDKHQAWDQQIPYIPSAACNNYYTTAATNSAPVPQPTAPIEVPSQPTPIEVPAQQPSVPEVPDPDAPQHQPEPDLPATPTPPQPEPDPAPAPETPPLPSNIIAAVKAPPETLEMQQLKAMHAAIAKLNATACNEYLNDAALRAKFIFALDNFLRSEFTKPNLPYQNFFSALQIDAEQCWQFAKIAISPKGFRNLLIQRLLHFSDEELLALHHKHDLYNSFGLLLIKEPARNQIKTDLRNKIHKYIRTAKIKPAAVAPPPVKPAAPTEPKKRAVAPVKTETPPATPRNSAAILRHALASNDHIKFKTLGLNNREENKTALIFLNSMLLTPENDLSEIFLSYLDLSNEYYANIIHNPALPQHTLLNLLRCILQFKDDRFFEFNMYHSLEATLRATINEDEPAAEVAVVLAALNSKVQHCLKLATDEAMNFFTQLATIKPGSQIAVGSYIFLANTRRDTEQKSVLMHAIEKKLHPDVIKNLILASNGNVLLRLDANNRNVFHYWALYQTDDSVDIIKTLWPSFKSHVMHHPQPMQIINSQETDTGNTFLHTIVQTFPHEKALQILVSMFSQDIGNQFAAAILLRNHADKTVVDLAEEADEWSQDLIAGFLVHLSRVCIPFAAQFPELITSYFPKGEPFFGTHVSKNIQRLLDRGAYHIVTDLVLLHNSIRLPLGTSSIYTFFVHDMDAVERKTATLIKKRVVDHFGAVELLDNFYYKPEDSDCAVSKTLMEILNEIAVRPGNETILRSLDIPVFQGITEELPIEATIPWLRIKRYLANPQTDKLTPSEILSYVNRLKPRINRCNKLTLFTPLDLAMLDENLPLVKFLYVECGAQITPVVAKHAIMFAFNATPTYPNPHLASKRAAIANYIYQHSDIKRDPTTLLSAAIVMYKLALTVPMGFTLMHWLIKQGLTYDITFENKEHLFHRVLKKLNDANFAVALPALQAMFDPSNDLLDILRKKNGEGFTCIYYVFYAALKQTLNYENLRQIVALYLGCDGQLIDIGLKQNTTILHLTFILKDLPLFTLILDKISKTDLQKLITIADQQNKNIFTFIESIQNSDPTIPAMYNILTAKIAALGIGLPTQNTVNKPTAVCTP